MALPTDSCDRTGCSSLYIRSWRRAEMSHIGTRRGMRLPSRFAWICLHTSRIGRQGIKTFRKFRFLPEQARLIRRKDPGAACRKLPTRRRRLYPAENVKLREKALQSHLQANNQAGPERWPSGRRRSPAKGVYVKSVSRVRIPSSPPSLRSEFFGDLRIAELPAAALIRASKFPVTGTKNSAAPYRRIHKRILTYL